MQFFKIFFVVVFPLLPVTPITFPLYLPIATLADSIRHFSGLLTKIIFDDLTEGFKILLFFTIARDAPFLIASLA